MSMDRTTTAILTGGLSEVGGLFGDEGSDNTDEMMAMIAANTAQAEKQYKPYVKGGRSAQNQMMAQLGLGKREAFDVTQLPGYQNALQQGMNAVNQGGAGSGMLMSGDRLQGLQSTGQNIFGDYYNSYMSRLGGMANQGFNAVGNLANIRTGGTTQQIGLMQNEQAQQANMTSDLLGLAGTGLGAMFGGPMGAAVGSQVAAVADGSGTGAGSTGGTWNWRF